ncbi:MAG: hypothetical protein JSC085_000559 [Candidatus Tokpelaia sp. JSC085]|nr:MAG: hypothetical protein JSC085_000559 [Candidatus Tokpelaia sp. JSC085]
MSVKRCKTGKKEEGLKVLTANRLIDGRPVWYSTDGNWSRDINNAAVVDNQQAWSCLEQVGRKAMANNEIVDAVLIGIIEHEGKLYASRLREHIRAYGPTGSCT